MKPPSHWRNFLQAFTGILIGITVLITTFIWWQWLRNDGGFEAWYVASGALLAGLWALKRYLLNQATNDQLASRRPPTSHLPFPAPNLTPLRQQMNNLFTLDDIRAIAFDLQLNYDNMPGQTLDAKIISLLTYINQHNQLPILQAKLTELRPHADWQFPDSQSPTLNPYQDRNRINFLNTLKTTWLDRFPYQPSHNETIQLTMTPLNGGMLAREVQQRRWHMLVKQQTTQVGKPVNKPIDVVFNECGRSLLILGDPGSGKTITLLQLAEHLLNDASLPDQPMPVILNLSSWAEKKAALSDWVAEDMCKQYGVGKELARRWIDSNQLIYLLDGLDEVAEEARNACITAINQFRADQPATVEMVVCSRTDGYEKLTQRLNLNSAIQIQPLNEQQINDYLRQAKMEVVKGVFKTDPTLRELARNPLMLNVMTLPYRGKTFAELQTLKNIEARRQHLFDAYIDAVFPYDPLKTADFTRLEAIQWLTNLAYGLIKHGQSSFHIERIQPTWLPQNQYEHYRGTAATLDGIISGLILGILLGASIAIDGNWVGGIALGLLLGLITGITVRIGIILNWKPGLLFGNLFVPEIKMVEQLSMKRIPKQKFWGVLFDTLWTSLFVGLFIGMLFGVIIGTTVGISGGLYTGLFFGLFFMACTLLWEGTSNGQKAFLEVDNNTAKQSPNQGVYFTLKKALMRGIFGGAIVGSTLGLLVGGLLWSVLTVYGASVEDMTQLLIGTMLAGLIVAPIHLFLRYGGVVVVQHYVLRCLLSHHNILPFPLHDKKLIAYLNAMVDRILLRRAGNGYMFIHPSFMEHFSAKKQ